MVSKDGIIWVDRSRVETRLECTRERYLAYHWEGTGITDHTVKYEADFGSIVHEGLNDILTVGYVQDNTIATLTALTKNLPPHTQEEQEELFDYLVNGWTQYHYPKLGLHYKLLESEKEHEVIFSPENYLPSNLAPLVRPVGVRFRPDAILEHKETGTLYIADFKTTSKASDDWNKNLDDSLQSHIYCEAAKILYPDHYVGGIFYYGLVKGHREIDRAKSSPFNGTEIQYGSPLYGWEKNGKPVEKWSVGCTKVFIRNPLLHAKAYGIDMEDYFPMTIPYKPLGTNEIIGAMIVGENNFENGLSFFEELPVGDPVKAYYEQVMMEPNLKRCFKYGSKHPCQFVKVCHEKMPREEILNYYSKRVPHHPEGEKT